MTRIFKFLAILLVLTLIARGTSGATLARVVLATPQRSEIIDAVTNTATVYSTTDNIEISVPEGLEILEIPLNIGQSVEKGDVLAVFDLYILEETRARKLASLDTKRLDLERLRRTEDINTARRNLRRAQEDYATTVARGEADIEEASQPSASAERNHNRAIEDFYASLAQGEAEIAAAELALLNALADDTAIQNAERNHQRALEDYESTREQGEADIRNAQSAITPDRTAIENAQRDLQRARDDYDRTRRQTEEAVHTAYWALQAVWEADSNTIMAALAAFNQARNNADAAMLAAARRVEDAQEALAQAQRNFNATNQDEREREEEAIQAAKTRAAENLLTAERRLEDTKTALISAQEAFENNIKIAETTLQSVKNRAAENLVTATRRLEDSYVEEINIETLITQAEENRRQAARRVEDAETALRDIQQAAADTSAQNVITATVLELDIAALQNEIKKLDELIYTDGILYSQYDAVIYATEPIIELRDKNANGYEARMQIPRTSELYVGANAEVTTSGGNMFFTPTVQGIVSSISQPDENNLVTVTIALPDADWRVGERVDTQIIFSRATYDMSVPISALNSDNTGYFLHVVEERNTVMGLQSVVVRANVVIVASDSEMVSVMGAINRNSQVITGSNKAISAGDRIRTS